MLSVSRTVNQSFSSYLNLFVDPSDWLHGGEHKTRIWIGARLRPGKRKTHLLLNIQFVWDFFVFLNLTMANSL